MSMRKLYRAVSKDKCEAMWVGMSYGVPQGWHLTAASALNAFEPPPPVAPQLQPSAELPKPKRRRGRPRKMENQHGQKA